MSRRSVLTLVVLAGLALTGGPHLYSDDTGRPAETSELAYRFTPDDTIRYRIEQRLTGTRTFPGASGPTPINAELFSTIRMRCVRSLQDGTMEMSLDTEAANLKLGGKPAAGYEPPKHTHTVRITPAGAVRSMQQASGSENANPMFLKFSPIDAVALTAALPGRRVAIGDSWSAEIPLPLGGSGRLKCTFTLIDVKDISGKRAAVIKETFDTVRDAGASDEPSAAHGSQEGEAELLFDIEKGRLVSAKGVITSKLAAPVASKAGPDTGSKRNVTGLTLRSEFTVESLGRPGKANTAATD